MKKVELLAPAGSYESFLGAIHAGADAVYIGGQKYGARAYAENFTEEEVCLAIRYAHLFGRKLYLTVNTLVKEEELVELPGYIRPFYEEGLDGVIVQDLGVFALIREHFPGLSLHGSTQMTVTGAYGARFLQEQGASRVVPARELSLSEIREIKKTGIEVEAFIHGAMCYCYSGQCLFSSMLGGRSGNRGRCAQPCRLPYRVIASDETEIDSRRRKEGYPLSLKDMCTLPFLPELIEAGIDSFKIEGRMKKPEYAAGVTALYRKYIDRYYEAPEKPFGIEKEDMQKLRSLYIRSEIQEGYYHRHNGKEMITPDKPSYLGTEEGYLEEIRDSYLRNSMRLPVRGTVILETGREAVLELYPENEPEWKVCCQGQIVQAAQKQPLTKETVEKQLYKMGNTPYELRSLEISMGNDCFLPVKALNDLRRDAVCALEELLLQNSRRKHPGQSVQENAVDGAVSGKAAVCAAAAAASECRTSALQNIPVPYLAVQIEREEQLSAVWAETAVNRLYVNADLLFDVHGRCGSYDRLVSRLSAWKEESRDKSIFLVFPYILRLRDENYLNALKNEIDCTALWDGVMIRNLESLQWLRETGYQKQVMTDSGIYVWNTHAKRFLAQMGLSMTAPLECNKNEWHKMGISGMEIIVYGRIPLMITANCIRKTAAECLMGKKPDKPLLLQDRYRTAFPADTVCTHCYNVIYNSVPLSLHEYGRSVMQEEPAGVRLVFTTESAREIQDVFACFRNYTTEPERNRTAEFSYTKGHYKRGTE